MQVGTECSGILTYWGVLEIWQKRTLKVGRIRLLFSQLVHGHHALFLLWQLWNASGNYGCSKQLDISLLGILRDTGSY